MIGKIIIKEALLLLLMNVNLTAREIQRVAFLYVHTLSVHYSNKYDRFYRTLKVLSLTATCVLLYVYPQRIPMHEKRSTRHAKIG